MHMSDALVSPAVGGALWVATAGLVARSARRVREEPGDRLVPLMGVLGAFVFAAQMVNFAIPGTGSSGHLAGGLLLAVLLGPHAALLTMASVLMVQALFFADGGLLALGCNIVNLGFFPAFLGLPLYRVVAGRAPGRARLLLAGVLAGVASLAAGAVAVAAETRLSGISALPFRAFALLLVPVHVAIGVVEGLATAAVVAFVSRARPDLAPAVPGSARRALAGVLLAAVALAGTASWIASSRPDGLEWAVRRLGGEGEAGASGGGLHAILAGLQRRTAVLSGDGRPGPAAGAGRGTPLAGLAGSAITLAAAGVAGLAIARARRSR